jgi:zinc transporter ZupT
LRRLRAHRRRVPAAPRRRQDRLWPVILGTLTYLIAPAIVVVAWWVGKPLTPELLAVLAAFIGFVARTW